jgi:hypothetical protein
MSQSVDPLLHFSSTRDSWAARELISSVLSRRRSFDLLADQIRSGPGEERAKRASTSRTFARSQCMILLVQIFEKRSLWRAGHVGPPL